MKCDWVRDNLIFYVYNELEDDARYEVEQHLGRCPECTSELKATRKFHKPNTRIQDTMNEILEKFGEASGDTSRVVASQQKVAERERRAA